MAKTAFQQFLEEETNKVKGTYYPVKAGFLRRLFIKSAACSKLHPNPGDEFCFPDIGPNYGIISKYEQEYREAGKTVSNAEFKDSGISEPLMVEKTMPDGYMILNGHHRWAAALSVGVKRLRIKIVDLTQEEDIRKMLRSSGSSRRVSLDLDEVVFRPEGDPHLEKPLRFPLNRFYRERIRLGIPALFHTLNSLGYDIWVYTAHYYSYAYLRYLFKHYHAQVTGIVTGTARKTAGAAGSIKAMEKLFETKYESTIHIDNDMVLRTFRGSQQYEEHPLGGSPASWSLEVREIIGEMNKNA